MIPPPALSRGHFDRAAIRRADPTWLETAWRSAAVLAVAPDGSVGVVGPPERPRLALADCAGVPVDALRFFLGEHDARPCFAVVTEPDPATGPAERAGLRQVGALLDDVEAGLLVAAVALANWHATHTHCPRCGAPTEPAVGGWQRVCPADASEHYPRVDPAVIMLVHDGADRCLLGRQASWPPDRFSTLAGFVEPGESAEQAVAREVHEEAGVRVCDITYSASQPWPFPGSLMLGFTARAEPAAEPRLLDGELAEARWFGREELRSRQPAGLPPTISISSRLIAAWVDSS